MIVTKELDGKSEEGDHDDKLLKNINERFKIVLKFRRALLLSMKIRFDWNHEKQTKKIQFSSLVSFDKN